ncbi:MAG: long-chain fatty acid--CoA ligase [Candidatus Bathyarchaeota archaeon]|nr:MAG: long-chain fatty acid--CoA ligase [Candidatus Bathyarchaeota archaeon]
MRPWFQSWPTDIPKHLEYPEIALPSLFDETVRKYPDKSALVYFNREFTYRELKLLADRFASALSELGVRKGDRVAIFLPNIPQFVIAYYGLMKIGAVASAISPLYKEREVEHQLRDSEAETLVLLDLLYPTVEKTWQNTKLKNLIVTGLKDYMPTSTRMLGTLLRKIPSRKVETAPNIHSFTHLLSKATSTPPEVEINPIKDLAALQYTGGTTGIAKGAMLTHMNLVSNALMCAAWLRSEEGKDTFLAVLPLFHIYGMTTGMNGPIYLAGKIVLLPRFDVAGTLKAIQKHRVTVFCGAPAMYSMLLAHPELEKHDCTSVRFCISGSAPLPPEVQRKFMEVTKGVLVEGYGLTESSPVTHCNPLDRTMKTVKVGSIGLPWPDTEAKIVDLETGEGEMKGGETGELVVKGPQVMKGYWKMEQETQGVLRDGWLYTGDIGKMDETGYFYITDRKKDLIKYKGYSVYPRELEDVLYEHPSVKLCGVVGKPDPVAGEIPKAFITLKDGAAPNAQAIMDFVNEKVASYKAIREVEFRTDLPTNLLGKVVRRVLREEERANAQV